VINLGKIPKKHIVDACYLFQMSVVALTAQHHADLVLLRPDQHTLEMGDVFVALGYRFGRFVRGRRADRAQRSQTLAASTLKMWRQLYQLAIHRSFNSISVNISDYRNVYQSQINIFRWKTKSREANQLFNHCNLTFDKKFVLVLSSIYLLIRFLMFKFSVPECYNTLVSRYSIKKLLEMSLKNDTFQNLK